MCQKFELELKSPPISDSEFFFIVPHLKSVQKGRGTDNQEKEEGRNTYINPFPTIIVVGVLRRVGISKRCLMSESLLDKSSISCRKDLADFNLSFSKIPVGGFSISIFSDSCLTLGVRLNAGTSNVFASGLLGCSL
jgi:hypothetical protein